MTLERGSQFLLQGEFDLVVISDKLADGPGLRLLGQIARDSPDTLRIFAARRSRLQLLKGKLGPFGLFRTLAYPIEPQRLLSALTLARAGLEIEVAPRVVAAARRPTFERISLTSADAMFVAHVPTTVASMRRPPRRRVVASVASEVRPVVREVTFVARPVTPVARESTHGSLALASTPPRRTKVAVGAAIAGVFAVAALALNLFDAPVHVTVAAAPRQERVAPDALVPPLDSTPNALAPSFRPARSEPQRAERSTDPAKPDVQPADPQVAASTAPIADPSTFGSEAYEPIYSN